MVYSLTGYLAKVLLSFDYIEKRTFVKLYAYIVVVLFCLDSTYSISDNRYIILQSGTTVQNSGLLDYLLPQYTNESYVNIKVVAVGTGRAIENSKRGDGDVLLVHSQNDEEEFVRQGYGIKRYDLMYNHFVIVGPVRDPAGVNAAHSAPNALKLISKSQSKFISRADNSGTHQKEMSLWAKVNIDPQRSSGGWYLETGSGMGSTLRVAVGLQAYTLVDRATWVSYGNKEELKILYENNAELLNQYGVTIVNPEIHPHVNFVQAKQFVDWLLSERGQYAISAYRINKQQLFIPNAEVKK